MKGDAHIFGRRCPECGDVFQAKPMGYNALYCTDRCKRRAQRRRQPGTFKKARKRSYSRIKIDPTRYPKHLASCRKSARKNRMWLACYKVEKGCADCGYKDNPAALQLDHEGKKSIDFSDTRTSPTRMLAEIEAGKCVVRCANCHSVRTWALKNGIKYVPGMAQDPQAWLNAKPSK